jgi:hypothetical protein
MRKFTLYYQFIFLSSFVKIYTQIGNWQFFDDIPMMLFPGFTVTIGSVNLFLLIKKGWAVLTVSLYQNEMKNKLIGLF